MNKAEAKSNTTKKEPIIVLHVVGRMDIGGAESRIMDLYRNMDRDRIQFHFVQHTTDRCAFADEVESLGGKIYPIPRFRITNWFAYRKAWARLFREHPEIRIVHGHMTSTAAIYLPIAKKYGVHRTIAHARSAGTDPGLKGRVTRVLRRNLWKKADVCFACSKLASRAVFGRQVTYIPNAIEADRFAFDERVRQEVRQELNLEDRFVLGHVGRFNTVKNHPYLLEILKACMEVENEAGEKSETVLMLLGEGSEQERIRQLAEEMGVTDRVLFLGNRRDVHRYYQAMDCFLLPSFYEGLPGTAIEAQASGLPGILSDTVTEEAVVCENMLQLSIQDSPLSWAREIQRFRKLPKKREERQAIQRVKEAGFDVKVQAGRMQAFYLENS